MTETRWGIIGPGAIAHNFADGLKEASSGRLVAIASRDSRRRQDFGDAYAIAPDKRHAAYAALAADADIDAVYICTPHVFHAELAVMAMRAGKAALVEKPAGMTATQVVAMTEVAAEEGVFFGEAFMYRYHPQIAQLVEIIGSGEIGEIHHIRSAMTFRAPFNPDSRLFDRQLGGGALLDVGVYPASFARFIAGVAMGQAFANPVHLKGTGHIGETGVDEEAFALMRFDNGITAECATNIRRDMVNAGTIYGSRGTIHLPDPWIPGRNAGPSDAFIEVTVDGKSRTEEVRRKEQLFAFEAEAVSAAIRDGKQQPESPAVNWADSIGNAETMDRWRHEVGYDFVAGDPAVARRLPGLMPAGLPRMIMREIAGVDRPVSALIMGCDNKETVATGAVVWDAWMEAGGNAFDTAFHYAAGRNEKALGDWIAARGVANEVVVVVKGAHSPYCSPHIIDAQLNMSLERLGLDRAPIYILHRDNPEVPVGEFVDALNRLREAGRIDIFGGSNWSVERFAEANAYATAKGLEPLRILNNNLSLAVMMKPIWPGCITSNTPETLRYMRDNDVIHLSWSSQARGYFLPEALRNRLPVDTAPETCFGGTENAERRRRAETLADERGVSAHNIATAWVLAQSFPSLALIGPRSPGEIVSTLPALGVELTPAEVAWLNLEAEGR